MSQSVWERIELLMTEHGENPTSLSRALKLGRDTIRQIKIRNQKNPDAAGAHGETLAAIAEHYDVSMQWLQRGGRERGRFNPFETGDERSDVTAIAPRLGIRREVVAYVLAQNPGVTDVWVLFGMMYALETAVRAGAQKVPQLDVAEARSAPRATKSPKRE